MHTISGMINSTIGGLPGFGSHVKAAWGLWAKLFSAVPYGDPWIAAVALMVVIIVIDRIVRPRNQSYG